MHKISTSTYFLASLIYALYFFIMPSGGNEYDMGIWAQWTVYIYEHGIKHVYESGTNYMPGHLLVMKLYSLLCNSPQEIYKNIHYLKYFTLLFDVAGALLVCSLSRESGIQKMIFLILVLNPAYLYDNMLWGQFDSVFSCLAFASFLCIYRRKFISGILLYMLSLIFKFQAIVFFPAITLLIIYRLEDSFLWRKILFRTMWSIALIILVVLLIPLISDYTVNRIFETMVGSSAPSGYLSLNAANIWYLIWQGDLRWASDSTVFMNLSFKHWGLLMYAGSLLIALFPLIRAVLLKLINKKIELPFEVILIMFALSVLDFFYFNTQMHERYSFPAFLFLAAYAFQSGRWWLYGLFSVAFFLNIDKCLQVVKKFDYQSPAFDFRNISLFFLALILSLLFLLYNKHQKMNPENQ